MNNREVIDQVERGYRMAQPTQITYPESKTQAKDVANAQANVYKVRGLISYAYSLVFQRVLLVSIVG